MYCGMLLMDDRKLSARDKHLPQRRINQCLALLGLFVVPSFTKNKKRKKIKKKALPCKSKKKKKKKQKKTAKSQL